MTNSLDFADFLANNQLDSSYIELAEQWFCPLSDQIASACRAKGATYYLGINGCQGSGKSTLADFLVTHLQQAHQLSAISLSIDDFYFNQAARKHLGETVHPLFSTRGVPGTHDTSLAQHVLVALSKKGVAQIPRFNKATDNPLPRNQWQTIKTPVDVVIIEGWCVGAVAQNEDDLLEPTNELERIDDSNGSWRRYVNDKLGGCYQALFGRLDNLVMLKAPSFNQVFNWRVEQETKLRAKLDKQGKNETDALMDRDQIRRFIEHYQRITEHSLQSLPSRCNTVFELNKNRDITYASHPQPW